MSLVLWLQDTVEHLLLTGIVFISSFFSFFLSKRIVRDIVASKVHAPLVETVGKGWSSAALSKQAKEVEQKHEWMSDMASAMLLHGNDEGEWKGGEERGC